MKESIVDKILSSTGYLPPRNEDEMEAFEKIYSKVLIDESFHVDVDSIFSGSCHYKPNEEANDDILIAAEDMCMAARNYERMPKDIIEKLKKQHKGDVNKHK